MVQINKVAVVGAGTMGARIAVVMARAGYRVSLWSRSEPTLDKARTIVESLGAGEAVEFTTSFEACLSDAHLVSENVAEDVALKQRVLRDVERLVSEHCVITTNTSSVSITLLASALSQPQRLIGMHWFNPADTMPMIEIVRGAQTGDDICQRVRDICQHLGKETIVVNQDIPGFIINRLQYAMLREALYLVDAGIGSVEDVDRAVQRTLAPRWAAMGPMKLMDFAGLDTVEKVAGILLPELDNSAELPAWLKAKVADGKLGAKSGEGFYAWTAETAAAGMRHRDEIVRQLTGGEKHE